MHILRNPYGYSADEVRDARIWAGDEIESLRVQVAALQADAAEAERDALRADAERPPPAVPQWRSIDSAPKDGTPFFSFGPKGIFETSWDWVDGGGHPENGPSVCWWVSPHTEFCDGPYDAPTHWQPFPSPPKSNEPATEKS